jgi:hypothetical protein
LLRGDARITRQGLIGAERGIGDLRRQRRVMHFDPDLNGVALGATLRHQRFGDKVARRRLRVSGNPAPHAEPLQRRAKQAGVKIHFQMKLARDLRRQARGIQHFHGRVNGG